MLIVLLFLSIIVASFSTGRASSASLFRTWGGSGNDVANAVTIDSSQNIYLTGYTTSFGYPFARIFLLKYGSSGNLLLQESWGGPGDVGNDLAVDAAGNIFLVGSTSSFGNGSRDVIILKFNPQGQLAWQLAWGTKNYDEASGIALDPSGHVYVTGLEDGGTVFLLKLDSNGTLFWQRAWVGSGQDVGSDLAIDGSGNVYVAGTTRLFNVSSSCPSYPGNCSGNLLLKFNSTGSLQWQRMWRVDRESGDHANAIALDSSGNSYVAGDLGFGQCNRCLATISKLNSTGELLWERSWYDGNPFGYDHANDLALDSTGNVYVTGDASDVLHFMKLDSNGNALTIQTWGGSGGQSGRGITMDALETPIITGWTGQPGYKLNGNNIPLETRNSNISNLTSPTTPLHLTAMPVNGVLTTVAGNTTYAGSKDVFLSYGSLFPVPIFSPFTVVAGFGLILALTIRHFRKRGPPRVELIRRSQKSEYN